ncbi:MAG: RNA-binding protein [Chloroflexota bacterium]
MNLYVGNLPRQTTEDELREAFSAFGQVSSASIIKDKFSGESRGFAFVEMSDNAEAQAAIAGLNGKDFQGRTLTVNQARPREERFKSGGGPRPGGGFRPDRGPGGGSRDRNKRPGGGGRRSW